MIASTGNVLDCLSKIESGQPSPAKALRSENGEAKVVNGHAEFSEIEADRDIGGELFESLRKMVAFQNLVAAADREAERSARRTSGG